MRSNTENIAISSAAPEFFYSKNTVDGHNAIAAVDAQTGALLGAADLYPGVGFVPAQINEYVTLFGTSFGDTNPAYGAGEIPPGIGSVTGPVSLSIGGIFVSAENILYVGVAPFSPGEYQVNFRIPASVPDGDQPVVLTINGVSTSPGAYLTVKSPVAQ